MKITKRIAKGFNLALKGFSHIYNSGNHILMIPVMGILLGIPFFVYVLNLILIYSSDLTFLSSLHVSFLRNPGMMVPWLVKLAGLAILGLIATPVVGYFYSGIIKSISSKKKAGAKSLLGYGFVGLKSFSYWVLTFIASMIMINVFSMDIFWLDPSTYTIEFGVCSLFCIIWCFVVVSFLMKKIGLVGSVVKGFKVFFYNIVEIITGFITWIIIAVPLSLAFIILTKAVLLFMLDMGGLLLENFEWIYRIFPGIWFIIIATAWLLFVYEVCRTAKVK
ncbi:hypothetical protein KAW80_02065 [Candidatus Babeliales bacterium]|nr:hypothetical protein [Candidatus Babeliales bacterium]